MKENKTAKSAKAKEAKTAPASTKVLESVSFTLDNKGVFIESLGVTYSISSTSAISVKRIPLTLFIDKKGNVFNAYEKSGRFCPQFIAWALNMYEDCEGRISANEIARVWTAETGERVNPDALRKALKPLGYKVDPVRSVMGSHGAVRRNELYGPPVRKPGEKKPKTAPKDIADKKVHGKDKIVHGEEGRSLDLTTKTAKYFFTSRKSISLEKNAVAK